MDPRPYFLRSFNLAQGLLDDLLWFVKVDFSISTPFK